LGVYRFALPWQVARLVVAPQLAGGQLGNVAAEFGQASPNVINLTPDKGKRAAFGITSAS
jgi:hypothetical protein